MPQLSYSWQRKSILLFIARWFSIKTFIQVTWYKNIHAKLQNQYLANSKSLAFLLSNKFEIQRRFWQQQQLTTCMPWNTKNSRITLCLVLFPIPHRLPPTTLKLGSSLHLLTNAIYQNVCTIIAWEKKVCPTFWNGKRHGMLQKGFIVCTSLHVTSIKTSEFVLEEMGNFYFEH